MPCYSPLKGYKDSETGGLVFKAKAGSQEMDVACGQCIGCRLDRSRMWAMRIVHECSLPENQHGAVFVTLTYRDKIACTQAQKDAGLYIPKDWSLSVPKRDENGRQVQSSHFQKFMKKLRKSRPGVKLKFYHCGEYGNICKHGLQLDLVKCPRCNVGRPHYHAILINCPITDLVLYAQKDGVNRYTSPELTEIWGFGHVDIGSVTFQSAAYTARYIMKKVTGDLAEEHYRNYDDETGEEIQLQPEYASMSNGIGTGWYEKFKTDIWPSDEVPVPGHGIVKKVPRFYEEKLRAEDPELYEEIKLLRQVFRDTHSEEYSPERLMSKYKVKKAQASQLGRKAQ